jgi:hypothetical protein
MHSHPCSFCRTPVECPGTLERNVDGWPEVICGLYHLPGGSIADLLCDSCEASELKHSADCPCYECDHGQT